MNVNQIKIINYENNKIWINENQLNKNNLNNQMKKNQI